jgi:hypothetical protein
LYRKGRFHLRLLLARYVQLRELAFEFWTGLVVVLTVWPYCVGGVWHAYCVIGIGPCHLCVKIRLQVGRAVIALKAALGAADAPGHVDCLRSADLEAVAFCVLALVEQV